MRRELHRVIKKVTEDLDNNFNFNTAISAIMELVNAMYAHKDKAETINSALANELTHSLLLLLAPFVLILQKNCGMNWVKLHPFTQKNGLYMKNLLSL